MTIKLYIPNNMAKPIEVLMPGEEISLRPTLMPTETYTVCVTQFLMPDGRPKQIETELPVETQPFYESMLKHGCRIEMEVLTTSEVSMTISDPVEEVDIDIEVVSNGPEVIEALSRLLTRKSWENRNESN